MVILSLKSTKMSLPIHCTQLWRLESLEATFLGANEPVSKQSELEEIRPLGDNKAKNQILAYCPLFTQKADEAYGVANLGPRNSNKSDASFLSPACILKK